jgi:hypothetical protein
MHIFLNITQHIIYLVNFVQICNVHFAVCLVEFEKEIFCDSPAHREISLIPAIIIRKAKLTFVSFKISLSFVSL